MLGNLLLLLLILPHLLLLLLLLLLLPLLLLLLEVSQLFLAPSSVIKCITLNLAHKRF